MTILDDGINVLGSDWANGPTPTPTQATATAGAPGTIAPEPPASLAEGGLTMVADPATAWTEGQYVVLGDGTEAYWDGESWAEGRVPAPPAPQQATASTEAAYDPANYTVAEVQAYLAEHPDQTETVLAAERAGKNRVTLVNTEEN